MGRGTKAQAVVEPAWPQYRRIALDGILEPEMPARASMDERKMAELVQSMRELGQIEPISVEQHADHYVIITGHRRFLAARQLGWLEMSALVYAEGCASKLALMLHENTVREDLNPAEEALFMAEAREKLGLDEAGLVAMFKRSPEYIAGRFALLRGDPEIFAAVQRAEIKLGVAHQLNRITDEGMRRYYLDSAKRSDPPARVVQQWVGEWLSQERARQASMPAAGVSAPAGLDPSSGVGGSGNGYGAAVHAMSAAPAPFFGCQLCGGDRDPYNLIDVKIHRYEWERILEQVEKAARGGG